LIGYAAEWDRFAAENWTIFAATLVLFHHTICTKIMRVGMTQILDARRGAIDLTLHRCRTRRRRRNRRMQTSAAM
jgi:hypothetical protein